MPKSKKSPWISGLLSFLIPGLGQLYIGLKRRGYILFVSFWGCAILMALGMMLGTSFAPYNVIVLFVLYWSYWLWMALDAAGKAAVVLKPKASIWSMGMLVLAFFTIWISFEMMVEHSYKIRSGGMENTILPGDKIMVNKFVYGMRIPGAKRRIFMLQPINRGDIIAFRFPINAMENHCGGIQRHKIFMKRVVGLPGDEIRIEASRVYINGSEIGEPYARLIDAQRHVNHQDHLSQEEGQRLWESGQLDRTYGEVVRDYFGPIKVPPEAYFVMGDNRDHSCDSRFWGPVPDFDILGKAAVFYWPTDRRNNKIIDWLRVGKALN